MSVCKLPKNKWTKDGRKWSFVVWYQDLEGNRKQYRSKNFFTKKEAMYQERLFIEKVSFKDSSPSQITFKELFSSYLNYEKERVKSSTMKAYNSRIKYLSSIESIKVNQFNIKHFTLWHKKMQEFNISNDHRNRILKLLKAILNFANKWYNINTTNIYNKMYNFNSSDEVKKEMNFFTYKEFITFISTESDLLYKTFFETLYYCGLRKGEARALTWNDFDKENKSINITKNIVDNIDGKSFIITSPKTKSSIRSLPLPKVLYNDLNKLYNERKKLKSFSNTYFIFGTHIPLSDDLIRKRKNLNCKTANLKQIRMHDFRHSCASLLINNGANITIVAKYLGHTKINETLNTYSHMYKNKLDDIVKLIDNL